MGHRTTAATSIPPFHREREGSQRTWPTSGSASAWMMSELTLYTPEAESFNAFDTVISSLLARTLHLRDRAALLLEDPAFGTNARKKIMQARDQAIRGKAVV